MTPMKNLINRLFDTAAPMDNPIVQMMRAEHPANQFLDCQVVLKTGYAIAGILTTTSEEMLRLVAVAQRPDKSVILAEHFFEYGDVLTIVIGREMPKSLVQSANVGGNGKSPIILGH